LARARGYDHFVGFKRFLGSEERLCKSSSSLKEQEVESLVGANNRNAINGICGKQSVSRYPLNSNETTTTAIATIVVTEKTLF